MKERKYQNFKLLNLNFFKNVFWVFSLSKFIKFISFLMFLSLLLLSIPHCSNIAVKKGKIFYEPKHKFTADDLAVK